MSRLFQQKPNSVALVASPALGVVLHSNGQLGRLVLGGQSTIKLYVSGSTFNQLSYTIVCPRGQVDGSCSFGAANSSGISPITCPFGTSKDCVFNLIGNLISDVSNSFVMASQAPLSVSLIMPFYVRIYSQDLSAYVDSYTLVDATGCAASTVVSYGLRRLIVTARTWSGAGALDSVSSPVFEISGTSVVEVVSMRAAVFRAVDVAATEFNGGLDVAYASETSTSTVFVYLSGSVANPRVINVTIGQSDLFASVFTSNYFVYVLFCSVSSTSSSCNLYNIQESSAVFIQTLMVSRPISDADVFTVSSGQMFLSVSPKLYL